MDKIILATAMLLLAIASSTSAARHHLKRTDDVQVQCLKYCPDGFQTDSAGNSICQCACSPIMCTMQCPDNDFKKDEFGCNLCACNDCGSSQRTCRKFCEHGFVQDNNGCNVCECFQCPSNICYKYCANGFQTDDRGCQVCECN